MADRILVTGGAGFIGSHLVARLVDEGAEVVVIDSLEHQVHAGVRPALPRGVTFVEGSVGDRDLVERALAGIDSVVHLAAAVGVGQSMYQIERYVDVNTAATAGFLERLVNATRRPTRARGRLLDVHLRRGRIRLRHPWLRRTPTQTRKHNSTNAAGSAFALTVEPS